MLKCDDRFARQNRGGPPPEFPLASPSSSIVHHLSGPIGRAPTGTVRNRPPSVNDAPPTLLWAALVSVFTFVEPLCFDLPRTRAHARLLGPCFKTGPMRPPTSLSLRRWRSAAHPSSRSVWHVRRRGRLLTSLLDNGRRRKARRTGRLVSPRPNPPPRTPVIRSMKGPGRMGFDPHGFTHC